MSMHHDMSMACPTRSMGLRCEDSLSAERDPEAGAHGPCSGSNLLRCTYLWALPSPLVWRLEAP